MTQIIKKKDKNLIKTFCHRGGFSSSSSLAKRFAGRGGRIATMPDITNIRINDDTGEHWNEYYTSMSAEYFGTGSDGKFKIIVAHNVGPMSTTFGAQKVYAWKGEDDNDNGKGGRITQEQFLKLESGQYGEVSVVDFNNYINLYRLPFIQHIKLSEALVDPLAQARLGPKYEEYLLKQFEHSKEQHDLRGEHHPNDPCILNLENENGCGYRFVGQNKGYAVAHLLSTGRRDSSHGSRETHDMIDIACHGWSDGTRFIGVKPEFD